VSAWSLAQWREAQERANMKNNIRNQASETELKFAAPEAVIAALGEHPVFAAPATRDVLRSVYFDTPTLDLERAGFSLRVRKADGGFIQTLKLKSGANPMVRGEWETPVNGASVDAAALVATPFGGMMQGQVPSLAPLFVTTVERTRWLWANGSSVVEVSLDRGEVSAGERRESIGELELELKSGDAAALVDLAAELLRQAPLRLSFDSKAERGYRLALGRTLVPLTAQNGCVTAKASAADALRQVGWTCLTQVAVNLEQLRCHRSAEALHQARVGLRRLRAGLALFRPMAAGARLAEIRAETEWLAGELEAARDLDVFALKTFQPSRTGHEHRAGRRVLKSHLVGAQTCAYRRAVTAVESPRYARLLLTIAGWLETGDWTRSRKSKPACVRRMNAATFARPRLDHLRRKVLKSGRKIASLDAPKLHRLRIKVKKLRYAAEFFTSCFGATGGRKQQRFLAAVKDLQHHLGCLNDIAAAGRLADGLARDQKAEVGLAAQAIVGHRQAAAAKARTAALHAFASVRSSKPFWR
jgi:inorganic triphosphatase YgiF